MPLSTDPVTDSGWLRRRPGAALVGVLAAAAVTALIVWAVSGGGGKSSAPPPPLVKLGPMGLSSSGLQGFVSGTLKQPVYWAGQRDGDLYELTRTSSGNVYVRYLPPGVAVGDPRASFLIVVTYPYPNALQRLKPVASGAGVTLPGGGFALPDAAYPKSVHLAFPGVGYEVEVYDPSPRVARRVALSGAIQQVH